MPSIVPEKSQIFLSRESPPERARSTNARKNSTIGKSNQQFAPFLPERKHADCMKTFMLSRAYAKNSRVTRDDKKKIFLRVWESRVRTTRRKVLLETFSLFYNVIK